MVNISIYWSCSWGKWRLKNNHFGGVLQIVRHPSIQCWRIIYWMLPSGKLTVHYGKSPFWMGKSTISMAIFHSFLYVYQGVTHFYPKWAIPQSASSALSRLKWPWKNNFQTHPREIVDSWLYYYIIYLSNPCMVGVISINHPNSPHKKKNMHI